MSTVNSTSTLTLVNRPIVFDVQVGQAMELARKQQAVALALGDATLNGE